jgi:Meiotically up-regulated gene 113
MREHIIAAIKRIAYSTNGQPPGIQVFRNETGIKDHEWLGVFWARWGDALIEAGFQANQFNSKADSDTFLQKFANAIRHYKKFPTVAEQKLYRNFDPDFPDAKTLRVHFGIGSGMADAIRDWITRNPSYLDVTPHLPMVTAPLAVPKSSKRDGFVYLIKSGGFFKIGRGDELEKRIKQIRTALPDTSTLEHLIRTDDPPGIETYWHRRFADKRANGEWFKLSSQDVAAFKKRKYQ